MFSLQIEPSSETEWLEWVASNGEGVVYLGELVGAIACVCIYVCV